MSIINNSLNVITAVGRWAIPSLSQTKAAAITYIALQAIYPMAEWLGRQFPPLPGQRFMILASKSYFKGVQKYILEPLTSWEYDTYQKIYDRLSRNLPQAPQTFKDRAQIIALNFFGRCLANPPFSTFISAPLFEELAFRSPLLLTSGIANVCMVAISSLLFAAGHATSSDIPDQPGRVAALIAMGVTFAILTNIDGLQAAILAHMFYNFFTWVLNALKT